MSSRDLSVQKVRHELRRRTAQVCKIEKLTPAMLRITVAGEELEGFASPSFDDHVKLFIPSVSGQRPVFPDEVSMSAEGEQQPVAVMRDYTPRHYDADKQELTFDFVLHDNGPATDWAIGAQVGDYLGIGGPRGSFIVPLEFDWHILIGDETVIPAIGRRLAEMPPGKKVITLLETRLAAARLHFETEADLDLRWVLSDSEAGGDVTALEKAARQLSLPDGEGYVWAAGEYNVIKRIREHFVNDLGLDKSRIRAASYWRQGDVATHENF